MVQNFLRAGNSVHSEKAYTLGAIIEHCIKDNIPFILTKLSNGYYIESQG